MPKRLHHPAGLLRLVPALMLLSLLTACATRPPSLDERAVERLAEIPYPAQAQRGENLDIIVVRDGAEIRVANRTARSFRDAQLWLNKQYLHPVERLAIGDDNRFDLTAFINHYREPFPVASFLRPDRAEDLVLAELYDPRTDTRYPLMVRPPVEE